MESQELTTKYKVCRSCGLEFQVEVGEQLFLAERGLTEYVRCWACRQARKYARQTGILPRPAVVGADR